MHTSCDSVCPFVVVHPEAGVVGVAGGSLASSAALEPSSAHFARRGQLEPSSANFALKSFRECYVVSRADHSPAVLLF